MIDVKGFIQIPSFISNAEDQVAAIGELGPRQRTYSTDRQHYQDPAKDASELVIFSCKDNGSKVLFPSTLKDLCLDIMEEAFNNFVPEESFRQQVEVAFPDLNNVNTGTDRLHNGKVMTDWFSFDTIDSGVPVTIKLWLSNESFASEYDEYSHVIIQPATILEDYHDTYAKAQAAKNAFTLSVRNLAQNTAIGKKPPTQINIVELTWQDPTNDVNVVVTEWTVICYGEQALTYENMLEAIRQHLLDNSSHDLASWITFFPDLDNIDIIYLFPQWNNVSLSSSSTPGVGNNHYSSFALYDKGMDNLRKILTTPTLTIMKKYADVIFSIYKSIAIITVGSENNSDGHKRFSDIFPQYTVMNINDINIGRLPNQLSSFISLLNQVLVQAEFDDGTTLPPTGMVRYSSAGADFIEVIYSNVTYRVCTKDSYLPFT